MRSGTSTSLATTAPCVRSLYLMVLALLVILPSEALSQTNYTWNGSVSSAWNNAANWTPGTGFPLAVDNVTLVTGTNPLVLDINRSVTNLTVNSGNHDLNLRTLTYTGIGGFSGGSLSNGALVVNSTGLTTCSGTTFSVPFSGTTGRILFNGSLFNNAVTVSKTNGANDYSTGGNTFQADLGLNVSAGRIYLFHTNNDTYNGNIVLTSTGGGNGVFTGQNSGTAVLAAGRTISIGGGGFSSGQLRLRGLKQVGPTPQILTLTGATDLYLEAGTQFNGPVTFSAPGLFVTGTIFQQDAVLNKTGGGNDYSAGGNTFNGRVDLSNSGTGILFLNNTGTDQFNGDLSFANTNTGGIRFGNGGGASILAAGRVLSIGVPGFSSGSLHLRNFIQLGATPQSLTLTGNADFLIGGATVVTGTLSVQAPSVYVSGGTYDGYCSFTKTGPGNDYSSGGNTFNSVVELNNTGTGNLFLNDSGLDQFNADLLFSNTGTGGIRFGNNSGTAVLANGAFLGIGPAGFSNGMLSLKDFVQLGTTPQSLTLTGSADLVIRSGCVFHGSVQAIAPGITLSGGTFHSACSFTKSGNGNEYSAGGNIFHGPVEFGISGTGAMFLHDSGFDQFLEDVTVVGSGTGSIRFGNNSGSSELAVGRTISVGTAGFTSGGLYLNSFTQLGATPQSLVLTGTSRLQFGSATVFNGALVAEAPSLFLNGSTFNASANFTKTGTTDDVNTGGNVFNGTTEITNTGYGILYLNYSGFDQFNGDLLLNCTSTRGIRFGIASGSSQLAAGRTISVGGLGYTNGLLMLHSFTQLGSTPQSLTPHRHFRSTLRSGHHVQRRCDRGLTGDLLQRYHVQRHAARHEDRPHRRCVHRREHLQRPRHLQQYQSRPDVPAQYRGGSVQCRYRSEQHRNGRYPFRLFLRFRHACGRPHGHHRRFGLHRWHPVVQVVHTGRSYRAEPGSLGHCGSVLRAGFHLRWRRHRYFSWPVLQRHHLQ